MGVVILFLMGIFSVNGWAEVKNGAKPQNGVWDFRLQPVWEAFNAKDEALAEVSRLRVDDNGKIFVFDSKHFKYFVFSPEGKFLYSFGKRGEGPGEYKRGDEFFLIGRYLVVADFGILHFFFKDGKYEKSINLGGRYFPRGFLTENRVLIVQPEDSKTKNTEKIKLYDIPTKQWTNIKEIESEKPLTASTSNIAVVIKDANTTPMLILINEGDKLYFGQNGKYYIQKTGLDGKLISSFSIQGTEPKKISETAKRKRFESIKLNGSPMPKELVDQMVKNMSDQCTYFSGLRIDESGLIYVYLTDPTNETGQELDIFSPDGKYLYHAAIKLPGGLKLFDPPVFKGNYLYVFVEDEEGEGKLVKYKITKPSV